MENPKQIPLELAQVWVNDRLADIVVIADDGTQFKSQVPGSIRKLAQTLWPGEELGVVHRDMGTLHKVAI
jgi:hypothetical protein